MPATFAQIQITLDFVRNLEGLRLDIRRNVQAAQALIANDPTKLAQLAALIAQDCQEYLNRRLGTYAAEFIAAHLSDLQAGAAALSLSPAEATAAINEMRAAVQALAAADMTTVANLNAALAAVLIAVPAHTNLFG
jgi:acyl-CoA synthetase (AMP-forming)/AMP-acid ligase II